MSKQEHKMKKNTVMLSPFMENWLKAVSERVGKNPNNQIRVSHGIHALILEDMKKKGIDTKKIYPRINS